MLLIGICLIRSTMEMGTYPDFGLRIKGFMPKLTNASLEPEPFPEAGLREFSVSIGVQAINRLAKNANCGDDCHCNATHQDGVFYR
jgi:hypothetical protein